MMAARTRLVAIVAGSAVLVVCWQLGRAQESAPGVTAKPTPTSDLLGGEDRYLTHVSTDKPIYQPGEKLYVRGVVLHHLTNKPIAEQFAAAVEILGPKGDVVASGEAGSEDGVLAFAWDIPAGQAGGQYIVKILHPWTGDAPAERKFEIRTYRAPRLRSQIQFLRDGYGPGDESVATLETTRSEGGVPVGAKVTIIARVDGVEVYRGESAVDATGHCVARFKLPDPIERGEGSLAMVIEDGGVVETASKSIPILLQTVDLKVYPEGGELVAGLSNRVYFEAFTPAHKPADLAGSVVDSAGREVAEFRSAHEGRGRFTFTPAAEQVYNLRITEPAGIRTTYPLPVARANGVVLTALDDISGTTVRLQLASTLAQAVTVTLRKRERELVHKRLSLADDRPIELELSRGDASGVLVATVWDAAGAPLAERLVFARPEHEVRVSISADRPRYVPAGKAALSVTTTDEGGQPISAVVGLAVTDDSVLEMVEHREQPPRLPAMVLLESDVSDLADSHVYLDRQNPQAPMAVDLLLGTQGWRRFAFVDVAKFIEQQGEAGRRALALRLPSREEMLRRRGGLAFGGLGLELRDKGNWRFFAEDQLGAPLPAALPQNPVILDDLAQDGLLRDSVLGDRSARAEVANGPGLAFGAARSAEPPFPEQSASIGEVDHDRAELAAGLERAQSAGRLLKLLPNQAAEARSDFVPIRVFAHTARADRTPGERIDFTGTLFWHAGLKTDASGKATIEFDLNDAVTSFRVFGDAFSAAGALGSATTAIESVEPFYVEPKLPLEVSSGDVVIAPVGIVNSTSQTLKAMLTIDSPLFAGEHVRTTTVEIPADSRTRHLLRLPIGESYGAMPVLHFANAGEFADHVTRTITVKPLGFPVERGRGGLIEADGVVNHVIEIPQTVVAGSLRTKAIVYPTPLASMTEALARLIQEPCGCFEQTSSTVYPLVMAQQYFLDHQGVDPTLIERSAKILETGYARLVGFESKSGGYEWFGADPGHDALTAYGLMEFSDMARVRNVDPAMLERTRKWLLEQRDGTGGFARRTHTLHTWLPDPEVANTYNTWALLESGVKGDFKTEVDWVRDAADRSHNSYVIALAANVLAAAGDKDSEARLLDALAGRQQSDGALSGATVSVVGSGGEALSIETTALAVLAWLHDDRYAAQVEKAVQFLAECCKAGRFGSTQSTVLALRAITAYDRSRAQPTAPGELRLLVDGRAIGDAVAFTCQTQGAIELPDFAKHLTPGPHQVQLKMSGGSKMPFSLAAEFFASKPDSSTNCQLDLAVSLTDSIVTEGELTEAHLKVGNRRDVTVPNPIVIVGIPGGLEVRHDQLKELVKSGKIAAYEVLGRDLVLYWRSLSPNAEVELPIRVVAAIPGRYTGPASRAYLYYSDEDKTWADGLRVEIVPRRTTAQ